MESSPTLVKNKTLGILLDGFLFLSMLVLGILTIALNPVKLRIAFGVMSLTFAAGEGFHFATRVFSFCGKDPAKCRTLLGLGDLLISVFMTLGFLVFLFLDYYFYLSQNAFFFMTGCLVACVRIIACCFSDNHWTKGPAPTFGVRRFRNIPMVLLMLLGFINALIANFDDNLWLAPAGWFYLPIMIAILGYSAAVEFGPRNPKFYGGMGFLALALLALAILGLFL
jgi:hypothetical protein